MHVIFIICIVNSKFQKQIGIKIIDAINIFIPEIQLESVDIIPDFDYNTLNITINYRLLISNTPDQVTVQFQ